jgi:hypothetical protein
LFTLWGTFDHSIFLIAFDLIKVQKATFSDFNAIVKVADFNCVESRPSQRGSIGTVSGSLGKRWGQLAVSTSWLRIVGDLFSPVLDQTGVFVFPLKEK